ncbi:unnamed protein product [Cylicocyclus nassatus]|uniref:HTH CENPB-type domain-containing protein n=1 Tax=Cylicocyclus nassatus TaxID=53992 RepID=A0AA36M2V0_CYLNA|nr:unnamed protein product [Cylicocyclus nassatus]
MAGPDHSQTSGTSQPSEELAGDGDKSKDDAHRAIQQVKGFRYAVVDIDCNTGDKLYDLLVDNGFNSFVFLNNLRDHPALQDPSEKDAATKAPEKRQELDKRTDVDDQQATSAFSTPPLFATAKKENADAGDDLDELPFFEEVSATDLLGQSGERASKEPYADMIVLDDSDSPGPSSDHGTVDAAELMQSSSAEVHGEVGGVIEHVSRPLSKQTPKGAFVNCLLCKNMITISRFSNLKNHARRHSVIKKFSCAYCNFQHNEHARIRAHMLALHQDSTSDVVDNSTPANIKLWDYLVEKCFAHFLASGQAKELPSDDNSSSAGGEEYKCKECSDVFVGPESPDDDGLVLLLHLENHLKTVHNTDCLECTICLVCGYENADENTVNDHVIHGHADVPAGKNLAVVPKPNYHALITAYFPAAAEFTKLRLDPPAGDIRLSNGQICIKGKTLSQNCDEVTEIDEDGNVSTQLACKAAHENLEAESDEDMDTTDDEFDSSWSDDEEEGPSTRGSSIKKEGSIKFGRVEVSEELVEKAIAFYRSTAKGFRSLKTMNNRFRFISSPHHIQKLRKFEEQRQIQADRRIRLRRLAEKLRSEVYLQFGMGVTLHDSDIRRLALKINEEEFNIDRFKASSNWIKDFRKRNGIVLQHVTARSRKKLDRLADATRSFMLEVKEEMERWPASAVCNASQSAQSVPSSSISFTIIPTIYADGHLGKKLFVVMQEKSGSFPTSFFRADNLELRARSTLTMDKKLLADWVKTCLFPAKNSANKLLLVDTWVSSKDQVTIEAAVPGGQQIKIKNIPAEANARIQPLDYFFLQFRAMYERFSSHVIAHSLDFRLQSRVSLCNRFLDCDDLPELVTHAKAHYIIKQFECSRCGFGSNERAALSQHVYLKHRNAAVEILEHDGEIIRKAWTQVVRICFPKLAMKLKKERNARRQRPIKSARRAAAAK